MNGIVLFRLICVLLGAPVSAAPAPVGAWHFLPCGARSRAEIAKLTGAEFARQVQRSPIRHGVPGSAIPAGTASLESAVPAVNASLEPAVPAGEKDTRRDQSSPEASARHRGASQGALPDPRWRPARFPHAEFDRIQSQNNVYGWYGCLVTVPNAVEGHDLVLDLGVIDDADVAYVNGVEVGKTGSFEDVGKSGWCRDRRYRVPAKLLKPGKNLVLVQVKDFWGLGGMVGPPMIGAAVVGPETKWQFLALGTSFPFSSDPLEGDGPPEPRVPESGGMHGSRGPDFERCFAPALRSPSKGMHLPPLPRKGWTDVPIPDVGWDARQKGNNVYGAYRLRFRLSRTGARQLAESATAAFAVLRGRLPGPVLDLGPVFDVAAVYLNGVRIAQVGRFPGPGRPALLETAKRLRFFVPVERLRSDGKPNDLVVIVYNTVQRGGLPGIPAWVWQLPARAEFAPGVGAGFEMIDLYAAAGDFRNAWDCMDALAKTKLSPTEDAAFQSKQVWLYWLEARSDPKVRSMRIPQALATFQNLIAEHWDETVSQDAMQVFCATLRQAESDRELRKIVVEFFPKLNLESTGFPGGRRSLGAVRSGSASGGPRVAVGATSVAADIKRKAAQPSRLPFTGGTPAPLSPGPGPVLYLGPDRATRGDWPMYYGSDSWVLAAMGQITDWFGGPLQVRRQLYIPGDKDKPREWLNPSARAIDDIRALLMPGRYDRALAKAPVPTLEHMTGPILPGVPVRRAAWWDDHGEQHAFDEQGPDLCVRIAIPKGDHLLSFYVLDHDWQGTWHPRQQSMTLFNADGDLLSAVWTGKFGRGVYERFLVQGPLDLTVRFFKHRSACVAVSAFFLDRIRPLPRFADLQSVVPRSKRAVIPGWAKTWDRLAALSEAALEGKDGDADEFCPWSDAARGIAGFLGRTADADARARLALVLLESVRGEWDAARTVLARGLRNETEVRAVGAFLSELLHRRGPLRWSYLTACRYIELADKAPAARVRHDLERAIRACNTPPLYPIRHWLFQEWRKKGFPTGRLLAEAQRVADKSLGLRVARKLDPRAKAWFDRIKNEN